MRSWHDFHIVGYAVSGSPGALTFDLQWPYDATAPPPEGKLTFEGVEAYFLEHDLGAGIVDSFREVPLRAFLERWKSTFEQECQWGWPKFWRPSPYPRQPVDEVLEKALALLQQRDVKCIELSSSYGLSGWILAASIQEPTIEL